MIVPYSITLRIFARFASKRLRSKIIANASSSDIPFFKSLLANVLYLSLSFMWLILSCSFFLSSSAAFSCCFLSSSACLLAASSLASLSLSASSFLAYKEQNLSEVYFLSLQNLIISKINSHKPFYIFIRQYFCQSTLV